jgi:O-antigen/teichoic acid export membrane protein
MSIPLHFIAASLAVPALMLLYGGQFREAAMVVTLAPVLCLFKAFFAPAQSLLQSSEKQNYVIAATVMAGIIDIGVAWYFIPAHGAVGACFGNGAAQAFAVITMWVVAVRIFSVKLPWVLLAKIVLISALASLTAHLVAERLAPAAGILLGGSASLLVLLGLFYLLRVLEPEDRARLGTMTGMLPKRIAAPLNAVLLVFLPRAEDLASAGME